MKKNDFISNECPIPNQGAPGNTEYYWRAKAFDGDKWSEVWSSVWSFITPDSEFYSITYNGNGFDGGSVPSDSTLYLEGANVTIISSGSISYSLTPTDNTYNEGGF